MAKVVVSQLKGKAAHKIGATAASVGEKRVRGDDGELRTLRTVDAGSATFAKDLTVVFTRNVKRARRDNKLATGMLDVVPAKS